MKTGLKLGLCAALAVLVLLPEQAHAFRCRNKLVTEGMHEEDVIAICGEPATRRHLGYTVRLYPYAGYSTGRDINSRQPGGHRVFSEEVVVTEYVYNFGPRKLMRRLRFEGSVLVEIETLGYGYIEKRPAD